MNTMLKRLLQNLRKILHLTAIEQDVASIKKAIEDYELRTSTGPALLINQQQQIAAAITELLEAIQELRTISTNEHSRQAVLADQQQQLATPIMEMFGAIQELRTSITNERTRKDESDLQLAGVIAQLSNDIKRLGDTVDERARSTTLRQSDNDSQL